MSKAPQWDLLAMVQQHCPSLSAGCRLSKQAAKATLWQGLDIPHSLVPSSPREEMQQALCRKADSAEMFIGIHLLVPQRSSHQDDTIVSRFIPACCFTTLAAKTKCPGFSWDRIHFIPSSWNLDLVW